MCEFIKDRRFKYMYLSGLLGSLVGYLIAKVVVLRTLDLIELVAFLAVYAVISGLFTELIYRKKK